MRSDKRPTKRFAQRQHSKKRANARYGVSLSKRLEKDIIRLIQKGDTKILNISYRKNRSIHKIDTAKLKYWNDRTLKQYITVVYDKARKQIVTLW